MTVQAFLFLQSSINLEQLEKVDTLLKKQQTNFDTRKHHTDRMEHSESPRNPDFTFKERLVFY